MEEIKKKEQENSNSQEGLLKKRPRAIALTSGGLDSALAIKVMKDMGVEVIALNCHTAFCNCSNHSGKEVRHEPSYVAQKFGAELKILNVAEEYLEMVKNPKHGYGSQANPCIDCRIFMLKKAKKLMEETGADFIVTGEVLGQRPLSQHTSALRLIDKETGLEGLVVRPLSGQLMPDTKAEKEGLLDRKKMLSISGRSRKEQMKLAKELGYTDYATPAGGCLLTDPQFTRRFKDLLENKPKFSLKDVHRLKFGRHFRINGTKIVVGRNEMENKFLTLTGDGEARFEALEFKSPVVLLEGESTPEILQIVASITARYCDGKNEKTVKVKYEHNGSSGVIEIAPIEDSKLEQWRI